MKRLAVLLCLCVFGSSSALTGPADDKRLTDHHRKSVRFVASPSSCENGTTVCNMDAVVAAWIAGYIAPARGRTVIRSSTGELRRQTAKPDHEHMGVRDGNIKAEGTFCCAVSTQPPMCNPFGGGWPMQSVYAIWTRWREIMRRHGIETWALAGTLMGILRNSRQASLKTLCTQLRVCASCAHD